MRTFFVAALLLLCVCTSAGATPNEPFGARFVIAPAPPVVARRGAIIEANRALIASVAEQVSQKSQVDQLTWVNQLVDVALPGTDQCEARAFIKDAVLRQPILRFAAENVRLVVGSEGPTKPDHMVAAVRTAEGWRVLDDGHLVRGYQALLAGQIKPSFHALYTSQ